MARSWLIYGLCALTVVFMVVMSGCPSGQEIGVEEPVEVPMEEPAEEPATEAAQAETPTVADFEWTEAPTVDQIPSGTITGMVNGQAFEAKMVRVEKDEEGVFKLHVHNKAPDDPDDPTGMITDDDGWTLTFTMEEGATEQFVRAISDDKGDDEHVYYWYQQEDGTPMSMNYSWGAALEITEWTVEQPDEEAETFHTILGNIKGRVALVMDDDEKSWCAGEFDAVYYEW